MKKIITFFAALAMLCAAMPVKAQTTYTDETTGRSYHFDFQILGGDSAKIVHNDSYASLPSSILVPTTVEEGGNTYRVVEIGEGAFANCTNLEEPELGHNSDGGPLWRLDKKAFANCPNINWLDFYYISQIGDSAFAGCTNLDFDAGSWDDFVTIGANAFENCTKWAFAIIGKSVTSLGDCAFIGCTGITDIYLRADSLFDSPSVLSNRPFKGLENNIQYIEVHEYTKYIPLGMFYNMKNAKIDINCPSAKDMYRLKEIGKFAFWGCDTIDNAMLGKLFTNALTYVGTAAFEGCTKITEITLPVNLSDIGDYAFAGLTNLATINAVRPTPPAINAKVFDGCNADLKNITLSVTDAAYSAYNTANVWKDFNVQPTGGFWALTINIEHGSIQVVDTATNAVLDPTHIANNTVVKFVVNLDEGYTHRGEVGFEYSGKTLTVNKNQTIDVSTWLKKINARIVVPGGNGVKGTVTATANGTPISLPDGELFDYFTTLVLTCTPNAGYRFSHWGVKGGVAYDNPYTVIVNDSNTTSPSMIQLIAYFTELPKHTITFVNYDGTELQSSQVTEGDMPAYTGTTPTKPEDEDYTYEFNGWTPDIVAATADADYTATFTATAKPQGIEDISVDGSSAPRKITVDGAIYILRGNKIYTITGAEVK